MNPSPVRLGVIGCGVIAYWTHLRELRHLKNAVMLSAADPDPSARERAHRLTGVPVYETADELLQRDDIDAVVISVPTHLHADLAVAAARAHKHFYLEKPIASTATDACRVIEAARQAGVLGAIGFNRRFHPVCEQARTLIAGGRIGPVRAVQTVFCEPAPAGGIPAWKLKRSTGGGVLLDLASHHVDLLRWFLNQEAIEVAAQVTSRVSEDDTAWLRLTTSGGVETQSFFSLCAGRADFLEFIGDRGTLRVDRHRTSSTLRLSRRLGYGVRRAFVASSGDLLRWRVVRLLRPSYEPSYRRALSAFVELILSGKPGVATLNDGVACLQTILAAEESARTSQVIKLRVDRG